MNPIRGICLLLLVAFSAAWAQQTASAPSTPQSTTPVIYEDSAAGLTKYIDGMLDDAKYANPDKLLESIQLTEIPHYSEWYYKVRPKSSAESDRDSYARSLLQGQADLQRLIMALASLDGTLDIRKVNDNPQPGRGMEWGMLDSMQQPVDIWFARFVPRDSNVKPQFICYFYYVDGAFRLDTRIRMMNAIAVSGGGMQTITIDPNANGSVEHPYRVGGGVTAPRGKKTPQPEYSPEAKADHTAGVVIVNAVIGADGRVHDPKIARSLGHGLDEEALKTVQTWEFEPAMKDGTPVAVRIAIEINFHMNQ